MFKDPRMDMAFIRTRETAEEHCAKVAMSRADEIFKLRSEIKRIGEKINDLLDGLEDGEAKEALDAAREDRGIFPPVRIGETIYHITTCKNFPQVLDGTMYGPDGGHGTATGYYCPCELQENCPHPLDDEGGFDCDKHKNELAVFEDTVESIFVSQTEEVMNFDYSGSADFCEFGRTVFRDYEKAKAALEEIKNVENDRKG